MPNFMLSQNEALDSIQNVKENSEKNYVDTLQRTVQWGCENFEGFPFYVFQFIKRVDDMAGIKKMYHQARLTKPEPLPGTTLLRIRPDRPGDAVIMWTLPNEEEFDLYKYGRMFADVRVYENIKSFQTNRLNMTRPEDGDASENEIKAIYTVMRARGEMQKNIKPQSGFVRT